MGTFFLRSSVSLLAVCAVLTAGRGALAADSAERDATVSSKNAKSVEGEPYPWSAGARAILTRTGVGGMGVGLDAAYSVIPNLAVGAQYQVFVVDQGADPHYCVRCIRSGSSAFAFAEGRYWPEGWATPYARLGAGWAHLRGQRVEYDEGYTEDDLGLLVEAGLDLHYRWLSFRAFAFHHAMVGTELDEDRFIGSGIQLGARF